VLAQRAKILSSGSVFVRTNEIPLSNLTEYAQEISKAVYNCDIFGETGYKAKLASRIRIVRMFANPRKGLKEVGRKASYLIRQIIHRLYSRQSAEVEVLWQHSLQLEDEETCKPFAASSWIGKWEDRDGGRGGGQRMREYNV
jgi:hypothetical protein